ncbi:thioredoxin family protein [soil metagenome]
MHRRDFLRSSVLLAGTLGTAGTLVACSRSSGGIPSGEATLVPQVASFEVLTGSNQIVPFGLRTLQNTEVPDADVSVFLRDLNGERIGGPFPTEYTEEIDRALGLYIARLDLTEAGRLELVAVESDRYGTQAINVVAPQDSQVQVAGDEAVSVQTPTSDDKLGFAKLCTQEPPCGMHEVSLDAALKAGRPVMLLFATPAYCQTAVCGPATGTVDEIRASGDWGETAFIHCEIYSDQGQTVSRPVSRWKLPTEPWLFSVGADGMIAGRLDGPMLPSRVEAMAGEIAAA